MQLYKPVSLAKKLLVLLIFLFYLYIAAQVPYTHDDWDWGLPIGVERWLFASLNSRYAGNFFVVILTRSPLLKTVVMGTAFFAIPFLTARAGKREGEDFYGPFLFSNLLLLSMPQTVWQQTFGWVSGFSNYVLSACFFLLYLNLLGPVFEKKELKYGGGRAALLFFLCVMLQLFIENLTIFNIAFSLAILLYVGFTRRRLYLTHLLSFFGFVLGGAVMFGNSLMSSLLKTGQALSGMRRLTFSLGDGPAAILSKLIDRYVADIAVFLFDDNFILCTAVSVLCLCLAGKREGDKRLFRGFFCLLFALFALYFPIKKLWILPAGQKLHASFFCLLSTLFFVSVCLCVLLFAKGRGQKAKLLFFFLSAPAVILPILVIDIVGPRLFFTSNLFFALFCAALFAGLLPKSKTGAGNAGAALLAGLLLFTLYYGRIYLDIGRCTSLREDIIARAVTRNERLIILPTDAHRKYWWGRNPVAEWRRDCFKEFYGIPKQSEVFFTRPDQRE